MIMLKQHVGGITVRFPSATVLVDGPAARTYAKAVFSLPQLLQLVENYMTGKTIPLDTSADIKRRHEILQHVRELMSEVRD